MKRCKIFLILIIISLTFLLVSCQNNSLQISLGYKTLDMFVGEKIYLSANYDDFSEDGTLEFTSGDESIATVSNEGLLEAIKAGEVTITAKYNSHEAKILLTVKDVRTLKITGKQMVIIDETITLDANISLNEGESIIWESSDTSVASVNNGVVRGVRTGFAKIVAYLSTDSLVRDEINILVRSGDGIQDVIVNKIYNYSYDYTGTTDLSKLSEKIVNTVSEVKDSVIGVSNYKRSGANLVLQGVGSGVIIEKKDNLDNTYTYKIITNYHVIENYSTLKIYIGGEVDKEFEINSVLKSDKGKDLALISFTYDKSLPVAIFKENAVVSGEFVLAIGNPTGYDYYNSVTFGMVSYVNRSMSGEEVEFIQHDAAINPGNSGGALFDIDGKLIGINTLKIAKVTVEGMGFAINLEAIYEFLG